MATTHKPIAEDTPSTARFTARQGFVRRCHGDLHLRNIVLWNSQPCLFDAIEFDEGIAIIDTLYDLAFLLMDLEFMALKAEANFVVNRYLFHSDRERYSSPAVPESVPWWRSTGGPRPQRAQWESWRTKPRTTTMPPPDI